MMQKNTYNVTGDGIKIGQIESTCPDEESVIKCALYDNVLLEGQVWYHSDNVYKIMHTIAPDATYYATGMRLSDTSPYTGSYCYQIEWLLSQGVNIINQSATVPPEANNNLDDDTYINEYTEYTRWIDHIAFNHDVHFVVASGGDFGHLDWKRNWKIC